MPARFTGADIIIAHAQQSVPEMLAVQVNMLFWHIIVILKFGAGMGMAFAPDTIGTDVDEGDVIIAVVSLSHSNQKSLKLIEKYRIAIVRLPVYSILYSSLTGSEIIPLCSSLLYPLWSRISHPAFGAAYP